ncbi:MAG: hypothetical protein JW787_02135 [Sedimentisphaerales bacterium]|nr:hypothetical protein [Sedimentisphaerales bacterium]
MNQKKSHIVFWEMVLLIGSIPVFRGVWMIFDRLDFMNGVTGIVLSLAAGIVLCIIALLGMNNTDKETKDGSKS